jgi:hypothetical protein
MSRFFVLLLALSLPGTALAACGLDIHSPQAEVMEMSKTRSLIFFNDKATLVVNDVKDPRHLATGVCRGMGTIENGLFSGGEGACRYKEVAGEDVITSEWDITPQKTGEPVQGSWKSSGATGNTGKFANMRMKGTWTSLPIGGSRWCDE